MRKKRHWEQGWAELGYPLVTSQPQWDGHGWWHSNNDQPEDTGHHLEGHQWFRERDITEGQETDLNAKFPVLEPSFYFH
jgi:hypothetical protein